MIEMHCREMHTEGRTLTFKVYKEHGQTARLQVHQAVRQGVIAARPDETIHICEEDVATFLQGVLEAVAAMGIDVPSERKQTADERYAKIREVHPNAYRPWNDAEDEQLRNEVALGRSVKELAGVHGRKEGAIESRIKRLFTEEKDA